MRPFKRIHQPLSVMLQFMWHRHRKGNQFAIRRWKERFRAQKGDAP